MPGAGESAELINAIGALGVAPFVAAIMAIISLLAAYGMWRSQKPLIEGSSQAMRQITETQREFQRQAAEQQRSNGEERQQLIEVIKGNTQVLTTVDASIRSHNEATVAALKTLQVGATQHSEQQADMLNMLKEYRDEVHKGFAALRQEIASIAPAVSGQLAKRIDELESMILAKPAQPGPSETPAATPGEVKDADLDGSARGDSGEG